MTDKKPLNEGNVRGTIKGNGSNSSNYKPTNLKPISPPPAPKPSQPAKS